MHAVSLVECDASLRDGVGGLLYFDEEWQVGAQIEQLLEDVAANAAVALGVADGEVLDVGEMAEVPQGGKSCEARRIACFYHVGVHECAVVYELQPLGGRAAFIDGESTFVELYAWCLVAGCIGDDGCAGHGVRDEGVAFSSSTKCRVSICESRARSEASLSSRTLMVSLVPVAE